MELIYNPVFLEHDTGMHPENKKRLSALGELPETELVNGEKYLGLVHTPDYIEKVKAACVTGGHIDGDTLLCLQQEAIDQISEGNPDHYQQGQVRRGHPLR